MILFSYNRQQQQATVTDQNGTVHAYDYDKLGRQTQDRVTTLGANVDDAVRRIEMTYEVRGMRKHLTSYDNPTVGQGTVVNDVQFAYNDFGQLVSDYQAHGGAVNTSTTPKSEYTYASGADNTIRPTALVYPNSRQLNYSYGTAGEIDDACSRVNAIEDNATSIDLAAYEYLGMNTFVNVDSTQADLRYTLESLTGSNDPDTGDIYAGFDLFSRVKDVRWRNTSSATDLSRIEYGYNRASNRIWRKNPTDPSNQYDWLYDYDAIQRLKSGERGTLNGSETAITSPQFAQCWSMDATGNWQKFLEDDNGDQTWNLNQARTSNTVNEITDITESAGPSWVTPAYSKTGNMTTIPQQSDPTSSYTATYDAWNRLVKLVEGANTVQENEYDGRNFRVIKKSYASGVLNETRDYYFSSNWQILEERIDGSSTPDRHFVWGTRYIDDLICRDRSDTGTLDERLYACPDANWNVTALVNTSGAVAERIEYDPYGNTTWLSSSFVVQSSSSYDWETTYCSYRYENNTGLFHIRHRNYHPILGIWLQRDPLGLSAGVILYAYANHNYLNKIDPRGLDVIVFDGPGPAGGIPAPKPKPGQVCGFYVWLYTGRACVDEDVYEDALDAAAEVLTCWWNCELKTHTKITNVVSGTVVSTASWSVLERLRFSQKTAKELVVYGGRSDKTATSILSRFAQWLKNNQWNRSGKVFRYHMRYIKTDPIKSVGRTCAIGVIITETVIGISCAYSCK